MTAPDNTLKGLSASQEEFDGSNLRILIVHTRWNSQIIDHLVKGTIDTLIKTGVKRENLVLENTLRRAQYPDSLIAGSQTQASLGSADLLATLDPLAAPTPTPIASSTRLSGTFDAVIAIGVLIKGSTMHFEYIADAVTHGLMRVGLDTGVPVIFGVLTCLNDKQALQRAGVTVDGQKGHNHGEDWGLAAVEQAVKIQRWAKGDFASA